MPNESYIRVRSFRVDGQYSAAGPEQSGVVSTKESIIRIGREQRMGTTRDLWGGGRCERRRGALELGRARGNLLVNLGSGAMGGAQV